ncbi:MAG: hypothetical protein WB780_20420 [Candidatus Acidiferrales bacterium]
MSRFASGILRPTSVLWLLNSDSHIEILDYFRIADDQLPPNFIAYELVPTGDDLQNPDKWKFHIDQDVLPGWFNPVQDEARARAALSTRFPDRIKNLSMSGNLNLCRLTSLPANVKLSARGNLNLCSLTTLPANVELSAGGYIDLRSLTTLAANVKLSAGGYLDLSSLTTLPANVKLSAGGYLYLYNLKGNMSENMILMGRVIRSTKQHLID